MERHRQTSALTLLPERTVMQAQSRRSASTQTVKVKGCGRVGSGKGGLACRRASARRGHTVIKLSGIGFSAAATTWCLRQRRVRDLHSHSPMLLAVLLPQTMNKP